MKAIQQSPSANAGGKKKKIILISLAVAGAGVASFFGYKWWQKRKAEKADTSSDGSDAALPPAPDKSTFTSDVTLPPSSAFPLKKGSRGAKVKAFQNALIAKYGKSILPRYGADGGFGGEMINALKKAGLPSTIDESTFTAWVPGDVPSDSVVDAKGLAKKLYDNSVSGNFSAVLSALSKMSSTADYSAVSKEFQNYRIGGVRETLVNGILSSFSDETQKQQIRVEFSRMGLKYDGNKWSLSGLDGCQIITIQSCYVWESPQRAIKVPSKMILGREICQRDGYTLFENSGKHFLIKTNSTKNL